jgi:hypothetical protein
MGEDGPAAGAVVRLQARQEETRTDDDGRFSLSASVGPGARVTAFKPGYLIRGAPADDEPLVIRLAPLPMDDADQYAWIDPASDATRELACANCHQQIYQEWRSTGHATSARNRRFLNLYDGTDWHGQPNVGWSLMAEYPDGVGICTPCHAPTVAPGDPAFDDLRQASGTASLGTHCDFCHKIQDAPISSLGLAHGRDGLDLLHPAEGQVFFGPLDDVDTGQATCAPLYQQSRYCASCHEGVVFGVHVYSTYTEWQESPAARAGQSCQSCHMAPTGKMRNMAPGRGGVDRDPTTLASHRDPGQRSDRLRASVDMALALRSESDGVQVGVSVKLRDVGHYLPTGFIDRHLILLVEGINGKEESAALSSGPTLPPAAGWRAGKPGRLYAKQAIDFEGNRPAPFWRAQPDVIDTRLRPDREELAEFVFPRDIARVRVRLFYRHFWEEVASIKKWPADEIVVLDQSVDVTSAEVAPP